MEDDSQAEAVPDADLPPDERIKKPPAKDDTKVPAEGDDIPARDSAVTENRGIYDNLEAEGYRPVEENP